MLAVSAFRRPDADIPACPSQSRNEYGAVWNTPNTNTPKTPAVVLALEHSSHFCLDSKQGILTLLPGLKAGNPDNTVWMTRERGACCSNIKVLRACFPIIEALRPRLPIEVFVGDCRTIRASTPATVALDPQNVNKPRQHYHYCTSYAAHNDNAERRRSSA